MVSSIQNNNKNNNIAHFKNGLSLLICFSLALKTKVYPVLRNVAASLRNLRWISHTHTLCIIVSDMRILLLLLQFCNLKFTMRENQNFKQKSYSEIELVIVLSYVSMICTTPPSLWVNRTIGRPQTGFECCLFRFFTRSMLLFFAYVFFSHVCCFLVISVCWKYLRFAINFSFSRSLFLSPKCTLFVVALYFLFFFFLL